MADIFDKEKRSLIMSSVKSKNSKAERIVFSYLRNEKIYFQRHYRSKEKINIDIALPRKKKAVFVDGDFWHGASYDKLLEKRGLEDYWTQKIKRNFERDIAQDKVLRVAGWKILRVWESELIRKKTRDNALRVIEKFLLEL